MSRGMGRERRKEERGKRRKRIDRKLLELRSPVNSASGFLSCILYFFYLLRSDPVLSGLFSLLFIRAMSNKKARC